MPGASLRGRLGLHQRTEELAAVTHALEGVTDGQGAALLISLLGMLCEERGPLLVAVDDAHWLDDQTLDLL